MKTSISENPALLSVPELGLPPKYRMLLTLRTAFRNFCCCGISAHAAYIGTSHHVHRRAFYFNRQIPFKWRYDRENIKSWISFRLLNNRKWRKRNNLSSQISLIRISAANKVNGLHLQQFSAHSATKRSAKLDDKDQLWNHLMRFSLQKSEFKFRSYWNNNKHSQFIKHAANKTLK